LLKQAQERIRELERQKSPAAQRGDERA
jgi:hypothetical protein